MRALRPLVFVVLASMSRLIGITNRANFTRLVMQNESGQTLRALVPSPYRYNNLVTDPIGFCQQKTRERMCPRVLGVSMGLTYFWYNRVFCKRLTRLMPKLSRRSKARCRFS